MLDRWLSPIARGSVKIGLISAGAHGLDGGLGGIVRIGHVRFGRKCGSVIGAAGVFGGIERLGRIAIFQSGFAADEKK